MNDVQRDPWAQSTVNVGVYGCTRAGKTRFLFQLLHGWSQADRILAQSPGVLTFMNTVKGEIDKHDRSMPTASTTPELAVTVREGNNTAFQFIFRDLRGELLSSELDDLDHLPTLKRDGVLNQQVKKCDAFLFFFDPAASEDPSRVERHHEREIKRARRFIEYILRERGNEHLPIVFVLTHKDIWENDPHVFAMAQSWLGRVNEQLRWLYASHLRRYCPESLTDPKLTATAVSSVRDNLEGVVDQVRRLVSDSRQFRAHVRQQSAKVLAAGILLLAGLILIGGWLVGREGTPALRSRVSPGLIPKTDEEVNRKLDDLDNLLARHPTGNRLADRQEAEKINWHLRWLSATIESETGNATTAGFADSTIERIQDRFQKAARLIAAKAQAARPPDLNQRVALLAAYLAELPDQTKISKDLAQAQRSFWTLARALVIEDLANVLRRREAVKSPPAATLRELAAQLDDSAYDVRSWAVAGASERAKLLEEIRTAETFCELLADGKIEAQLAVERAYVANNDSDGPTWRTIVIQSPGVPDQPSKEGINLRPGSAKEGVLEFSTKQPSYPIELGLGSPIVCDLAELTQDKTWRRAHQFDLTGQSQSDSLSVLGLPLARRRESSVLIELDWEGFHLSLRVSGLPPAPPLLWDAAATDNGENRS